MHPAKAELVTTHPFLISRKLYDAAVESGAHVCFRCGFVGAPLPLTSHEPSGLTERKCGTCCNASAVSVDRAVDERWLEVEP